MQAPQACVPSLTASTGAASPTVLRFAVRRFCRAPICRALCRLLPDVVGIYIRRCFPELSESTLDIHVQRAVGLVAGLDTSRRLFIHGVRDVWAAARGPSVGAPPNRARPGRCAPVRCSPWASSAAPPEDIDAKAAVDTALPSATPASCAPRSWLATSDFEDGTPDLGGVRGPLPLGGVRIPLRPRSLGGAPLIRFSAISGCLGQQRPWWNEGRTSQKLHFAKPKGMSSPG